MQSNTRGYFVSHARRNAMTLSAALAIGVALALPAASCAASDTNANAGEHKMAAKERVVFQVSDPDPKKWNLALNNVKNVQDALGKNKVDVELVVYGPGIDMLRIESAAGNRVNQAVADGVKVVACENTMHGMKLTKDDMLASIAYVPGGVIELMKRQQEGWSYIRP